jgi:NAD(P)-dependent dehydrogenase (short-subunit alcohol dehydrogenase family)
LASKIEFEIYSLPVAVVVGGYFILKQFGLFGGGAAAANQAGISDSTAAGVRAALQQAQTRGDIATINASEAAGIANSIFNAGIDPVDQDAMVRGVIQANTLTDLLMIVQAFGTKQAGGMMCSIFGGFLSATCGTYDLTSYLHATLDQAHIQTINNYLSNQGINYQF